jgi:hypothetical protein
VLRRLTGDRASVVVPFGALAASRSACVVNQ